MKTIIVSIVVATALTGCGKQTVEEICQETSNLLKEKNGEGFTQVGMLGCLKQGASRAKQDQEAIKQMLSK